MLSQEQLGDVLTGMLIMIPLVSAGLWLFHRGILRARYFLYILLPLSVTLANLAVVMRHPEFSTMGERLAASIVGTVLVTAPGLVILWIKKVDIDRWDRKKGR